MGTAAVTKRCWSIITRKRQVERLASFSYVLLHCRTGDPRVAPTAFLGRRAFFSYLLAGCRGDQPDRPLGSAFLEQPSGRLNKSPLHRSLMRTDLGRLAACYVEILSIPDKPYRVPRQARRSETARERATRWVAPTAFLGKRFRIINCVLASRWLAPACCGKAESVSRR